MPRPLILIGMYQNYLVPIIAMCLYFHSTDPVLLPSATCLLVTLLGSNRDPLSIGFVAFYWLHVFDIFTSQCRFHDSLFYTLPGRVLQIFVWLTIVGIKLNFLTLSFCTCAIELSWEKKKVTIVLTSLILIVKESQTCPEDNTDLLISN